MVDPYKIDRLRSIITQLESVLVAFSAGADSALLLAMSLDVLGADNVTAVTADSPTLPRSELAEASALAEELGVTHKIVTTEELQDKHFSSNPRDRCYYCKQELFARLTLMAHQLGCDHVVYGATASDLGDHRPGMRAATEAGAIAPLLDAGFTKKDVRDLSRRLGLRTWNKPSMACLSSRFPYGTPITEATLSRIEQAEDLLRHRLGFQQVRVRHHDSVARIEIDPLDFERMLSATVRDSVLSELRSLGYTYVTLDLQGFRSGSLNEPTPEASAQAQELNAATDFDPMPW
jgi:uncharacterized protein